MARTRAPAEQLRRLQIVTDGALAHLGLDELLAELLARVHEILEADTCAILMHDRDTNELVARAAIGIEEEVEQGVRIPVGRGFAGRVAASRAPVVLRRVDHSNVLNPILREKGIIALLGVPLLVGGDVLGVLHVGSLTPREFSDEDIELLQLVGDRAALAIEHARAYEAERAARIRLEQIQAVTDAALAHLELDDLFSELLVRIRDILDVDTVVVLLLDEDAEELVARAALGIEEEVEQGVRVPYGKGFAGTVVAERRPIILPDVDKANIHNPLLREKGLKTLLGVPLIVRDEAIGVLHIGSLRPREFTSADTELLQLVAERAAIAIERARLHEETVKLDALKLSFVAFASHELRTPATSIYGILATLRGRGDTLAAETRHELEVTLWEQAVRMRRLIEQLLDLSRLDARTVAIEPRPIVVRKMIEEIVADVAAQGEVRGLVLDVDEGLAVVADPMTIERVVSNLVANAYKHGEPPVTVSAHASDTHLRIVVADQGEGVPRGLEPRLFDRFQRGGYGDSGSGLGLAIARAYARAHGGDVVYDAPERGSRFELVLPVSR